nr:hypothetical protein K3N28_14500 [Glycomyces sp. TRM65418]
MATMAGGVIAAGALLQGDQVPGISALGGDGDGSDIIEGWFGMGADTTGQEAEASESAPEAPASGEAADPSAESASPEAESQARGGESGGGPAGSPGLVPVGEDRSSGPTGEESGTASPSPSPSSSQEPTEAPTTDEPTSAAPTSEAPSSAEPSPSESVSVSAEQAPRSAVVPMPQKGPTGG